MSALEYTWDVQWNEIRNRDSIRYQSSGTRSSSWYLPCSITFSFPSAWYLRSSDNGNWPYCTRGSQLLEALEGSRVTIADDGERLCYLFTKLSAKARIACV
jgi:hypothetical protein